MKSVYCQNFEFICDKSWEDLEETENEKVRFCGECKNNVYLSENIDELHSFGDKALCAAIEGENSITLGVAIAPEGYEPPEEYRRYDLRLVKQEVTPQKIMGFKKEIAPNLSLKEVGKVFESLPHIILEHQTKIDCLELQNKLNTYNIETEFMD